MIVLLADLLACSAQFASALLLYDPWSSDGCSTEWGVDAVSGWGLVGCLGQNRTVVLTSEHCQSIQLRESSYTLSRRTAPREPIECLAIIDEYSKYSYHVRMAISCMPGSLDVRQLKLVTHMRYWRAVQYAFS